MFKLISVLVVVLLTGCASLPENFSKLTSEQLLKGVANNNKPKIIPAKYVNASTAELSMHAANYNVVGSYGSGIVLDGIEESLKYCSDKSFKNLGVRTFKNRKILACENTGIEFLVIHYISRENAGRDTGVAYAYFDHLALFDIKGQLDSDKINWVVKQYLSFENATVDFEYVHNFQKIKESELVEFLSNYLQ